MFLMCVLDLLNKTVVDADLFLIFCISNLNVFVFLFPQENFC